MFSVQHPIFFNRDIEGNLHSTETFAIQWKGDFGLNFVKGVYFEEDLFSVFFKKKATPKEIMEMRNQDQKAVVIEKYGMDYVIGEMKPKLIDTFDGMSKVTGKKIHYELLRVKTPAGERNLFIAEDHSKHTRHPILVPIVSDIDNKEIIRWSQAGAWTFEMEEQEYLECIKEGES